MLLSFQAGTKDVLGAAPCWDAGASRASTTAKSSEMKKLMAQKVNKPQNKGSSPSFSEPALALRIIPPHIRSGHRCRTNSRRWELGGDELWCLGEGGKIFPSLAKSWVKTMERNDPDKVLWFPQRNRLSMVSRRLSENTERKAMALPQPRGETTTKPLWGRADEKGWYKHGCYCPQRVHGERRS